MSRHSAGRATAWQPGGAPDRIRVVVCDESPLLRRLTRLMLAASAGIDVVGEAGTGIEAIDLVRRLRPDVLTIDLSLPDLDGIGVLESLDDVPVHVVVVASTRDRGSSELVVDALAAGAVEVIDKPHDVTSHSVFAARLVESILNLAEAPRPLERRRHHDAVRPVPRARPVAAGERPRLLVIGASTGGPASLDYLMKALPDGFPSPIIVVQHMPSGFSAAFARRLHRSSSLDVREATDGAQIEPGTVLVARCGSHLHVEPDVVRVRRGERVNGMRPSVDVTLLDAARSWGDRVTAIILTGVGHDGREGARAIRTVGGRVAVEDRSTCAVWGMPRAVLEAGLADASVPLDGLPAWLEQEAAR